jgi:predicted RNA-binding Zn ribbon-like protein
MANVTIADDGAAFRLTWPTDRADAPLWPVARSAGDLLLSGDFARIGECPSCGWLFLDISRNGTRRWCSMATCGSRDKMARYHRRARS